jgi:hypothetical protein
MRDAAATPRDRASKRRCNDGDEQAMTPHATLLRDAPTHVTLAAISSLESAGYFDRRAGSSRHYGRPRRPRCRNSLWNRRIGSLGEQAQTILPVASSLNRRHGDAPNIIGKVSPRMRFRLRDSQSRNRVSRRQP